MSRPKVPRSVFPYLALREDFTDYAGRAFVQRIERQRGRLEAISADNAVGALIGAPTFESDTLVQLASRSRYAANFAAFKRVAKINEAQISALVDPSNETVQPFRVAMAFELIAPRGKAFESFCLDDLRRLKVPNALAALAACGEIDWKSATARTRAVFCLRALIGASRS